MCAQDVFSASATAGAGAATGGVVGAGDVTGGVAGGVVAGGGGGGGGGADFVPILMTGIFSGPACAPTYELTQTAASTTASMPMP